MSVAPDLSSAWSDLFMINADGTGLRQLTFNAPTQFTVNPTWAPDGQALAFEVAVSTDIGLTFQRSDIFAINVDGTGLTRLTSDGRSGQPAWGLAKIIRQASKGSLSMLEVERAIRDVKAMTGRDPLQTRIERRASPYEGIRLGLSSQATMPAAR